MGNLGNQLVNFLQQDSIKVANYSEGNSDLRRIFDCVILFYLSSIFNDSIHVQVSRVFLNCPFIFPAAHSSYLMIDDDLLTFFSFLQQLHTIFDVFSKRFRFNDLHI